MDASRSTADKVLRSGYSVNVYPGGVPEIFLSNPNTKEVRGAEFGLTIELEWVQVD